LNFRKKLILGTAQFSGKYGLLGKENHIYNSEIKRILQYLKKKKIFKLDTSIEYKHADKKINLVKNNKWQIITKVKFTDFQLNNMNQHQIRNFIIKKLIKSKKNIGIKKIDTLLIHNFEIIKNKNKSKIYKILLNLKNEKLINKIGYSIYNFRKLKDSITKFHPDVIQCSFNVFDRRLNEPSLSKIIKKNKIEVHARSVFLQGLLLRSYNLLPTKFNKWKKLFYNWEKWIKKNKISKIEGCLAFSLSNSNIKKVVIGVQKFEELKQILNKRRISRISLPAYLSTKDERLLNPSKW